MKNSVYLLYNQAKHSPSKEEVETLVIRTKMLRELLADPERVAFDDVHQRQCGMVLMGIMTA